MANTKKKAEEKDPEVVIESAIGRTEGWIMQNGRTLLYILAAVVLIVGGYFGYKYLITAPRAEKASAMIFMAQQQFEADEYELALNGDGNYAGFLEVISTYGSTPEGNLAKHYAGVCYLKLGNYEEALNYLKKYKSADGVPAALLNAQNYGLQGDAYAQMKNYAEAASMYEKAVSTSENSLTTPHYLKKAGMTYEMLGEYAKALDAYKRIEVDYADSMEGRDILKYIGRVEQLM